MEDNLNLLKKSTLTALKSSIESKVNSTLVTDIDSNLKQIRRDKFIDSLERRVRSKSNIYEYLTESDKKRNNIIIDDIFSKKETIKPFNSDVGFIEQIFLKNSNILEQKKTILEHLAELKKESFSDMDKKIAELANTIKDKSILDVNVLNNIKLLDTDRVHIKNLIAQLVKTNKGDYEARFQEIINAVSNLSEKFEKFNSNAAKTTSLINLIDTKIISVSIVFLMGYVIYKGIKKFTLSNEIVSELTKNNQHLIAEISNLKKNILSDTPKYAILSNIKIDGVIGNIGFNIIYKDILEAFKNLKNIKTQ